MAFDIQGAKAAGYSDTEIADHLAQQSNYDAAAARKAGYSDTEIVQHLSAQPSASAPVDKYAGMSIGERALNDLRDMWTNTKRAGLLAAKGANDAVVNTALLPANAATQASDLVTGGTTTLPSSTYQAWSDKGVPQATNLAERIVQSGAGFLAGSKIPIPGVQDAPPATGALAQSMAGARAAGYVVPPASVMPTLLNRTAEQLLGKKQLASEATQKNIPQVAKNIADEFSLPAVTEITHGAMDAVRAEAGKAYDAIASLKPVYSSVIEKIKALRSDANGYYRQISNNYDHDVAKKADNIWEQAQQLESKLAGSLKNSNLGSLYDNFVAARQTIAKAHDVDKAIVESRGTLKPETFASLFKKEKPLTGALMDAGRSAEAFPSAFTTKPGNLLSHWDAAVLGGSGAGAAWALTHDPALMIGALGSGALRLLGRKALLSAPYQNMLLASPEQKQAAISNALLRGGVASNSMAGQ